ncbi:MAG TPA: SusC/RagA family TonB-linked outer membrane protein [Gemmatimonadales bacterium]|nr:SusC/RagA family TonB-linked outer membrane protein [Gemmatimonadales bacterium]
MPQGFLRRTGALSLLLALAGLSSAAAQAGRISGQVSDQTGTPIAAARLLIVGTSYVETANGEGRYTFRNVTPAHYEIRVFAIGYQSKTDTVTVGSNETAALNFSLVSAPITLDEIVVTATGEQRKLEVANAVSTIDAATVAQESPITEFGNLISGRAPGVQVLKSAGTTGEGTRIRIRGSNSISLSNEPLFYVDGIRMESSATSSTLDVGGFGSGNGNNPSRINDLNPDDIESIEIVKGPAAATLYGIQASNGVVRITTKRGRSGRTRFNLFTELGAVTDNNTYPLNYNGRDTTATGVDYDGFCILQFELDGLCTQTSISVYSPLEDPATRPLKAGLRQVYGGNLSGGNEFMNYYVSGQYESEDGVFRLPKFEEDSVRKLLGSVPENQIRPNALTRVSVRANVGANLTSNSDIAVSAGYISSDARFVENDNSFLTITGSGEASGFPPDINRGWYYIPAELFAELATQGTERFTGGITHNWRPNNWLSTRATFGYDVVNRNDVQFFPTGQVADYLQNREGLRHDNRFQISQTSVDLGATARFALNPHMGSKTSVGAQFYRDLSTGTFATGIGLVPGSTTISNAATTESSEQTIESRTLGSYLEEEVSLRDRLFVTGAIRLDDNSAFGKNFNATVYPKFSASWLLSEEPFFHVGFLSTLRIRAAFGVSGQQPGTTDARRFFSPIAGKKTGVAETGVELTSLGNPNLKPERSREIEGGIDAALFNGRVSLELTVYNKKTTDLLLRRPLAGSLGSSSDQFFNLGEVRNRGVEIGLSTRLIDKPGLVWDLDLSGSFTSNKLVSLGNGVGTISVGFYQRHQEGYPLGGFWSRPLLGFNDANGDGIIDGTEVTLGDTAVFMGNALPTREFSLNSGVTIFHGRLRLGGQFDYRGGHVVDNSIENFRCTPVLNCRGLVDRKAPLEEQAKAIAAYTYGNSEFAFFEPGWFIKLREVSITYNAPDSWAHAFRADRLSITLSGRNLMTITDYSGVDPEVNAFGQDNFSTSDFESQPQVRYWLARVNVGF